MKNAKCFTENIVLILIKCILKIENSEGFVAENKELFKKIKDVPAYLLALIIFAGKIDKTNFFKIMKNNENLRLTAKEIVNFFYMVALIFNKNKSKEIKHITDYLSLISDLLLMVFIQKKINPESYGLITEDLQRIQKEIKLIEETKNISSKANSTFSLNLTEDKILKFATNISRCDFLIEKIKI